MLPSKDSEIATIPPRIRRLYAKFKNVSSANYFKVFNAISNSDGQPYTIRILDLNSELYNSNPNLAATLFIQELLRLCVLHPDTVVIEDFEICDKSIAFVTTPYLPLNLILKEDKGSQRIDIEGLIQDILTDLSFLVSDLKLHHKIKSDIIIDFENIYQLSGRKRYILGDWAKGFGYEKILMDISDAKAKTTYESNGDQEIQSFALKLLEIAGGKKDDLQDLRDLMTIKNPKMYMSGLETFFNGLTQTESIKKTLKSMLIKEGEGKMNLADFRKSLRKKLVEESKINDLAPADGPGLSKKLEIVQRFKTQGGGWSYREKNNINAITFKTSTDIFLTGIGLFIPHGDGVLKGIVSIIEGAAAKGTTILVSREVELRKDMPEADTKIFPLMFETAVKISAGRKYSIVGVFEKGPASYYGAEGKEKIENKKVIFEFSNCEHSESATDVKGGQFPLIYYAY